MGRLWLCLVAAWLTMAASPAHAGDVEWVPLGRFPLVQAEQGWGTLGVDQTVLGHPLLVNGRPVPGYGTHAPGRLSFGLDGLCRSFRVRVNVDSEVAYTKKGSVEFVILGDGRMLYDSGVVRVTNADLPKLATVDVTGVKALELVAGDGGDGNDSDHADWLEPEVTLAPRRRDETVGSVVRARGIDVKISHQGGVTAVRLLGEPMFQQFAACTRLLGETPVSHPSWRRTASGGISVTRDLRVGSHECQVLDRFDPIAGAVRWTAEIRSKGLAWSVPVSTILSFDDPRRRKLWLAWNDPVESHLGLGIGDAETSWNDPLLPQPFHNRLFTYGENANTNWWSGDVVTLPMITALDATGDRGISLIQSPEDPMPAAQIATGETGWCAFNRLNRRLGEGKTVRFTMLLVPHQFDPRTALAAFVERYPTHFYPPNPKVAAFGGCGAYSGDERQLDPEAIARLRQMDFRTMWKLSDDYAYMGMFIPPVSSPDERWNRIDDSESPPNYKPLWTSTARLNGYARMLKSNGFHLLSYFNVVEFGHDVHDVLGPVDPGEPALWKDPSRYLQANAPHAPLRPDGKHVIGAWQGGWALDPGDPGYRAHLLSQLDRHLRWLPDSEGICIDRLDYLCQYNDLADDGVTIHNGRPSRSLVNSWKDFMRLAGPKMHRASKVIFANVMDPRLDVARQLDGVYAEFGNQPTVVNGLSLLCLEKPLLAWTRNQDKLSDAFFQRHLYLGAFPTAPYPTNNHCVQPSPEHDRWYRDYGPLFKTLAGRRWVLLPHAIASGGAAKSNLFSVPGGYAASVTFASGPTVTVHLNGLPGLNRRTRFEAVLPGRSQAIPLVGSFKHRSVALRVPTGRGCAVVRAYLK